MNKCFARLRLAFLLFCSIINKEQRLLRCFDRIKVSIAENAEIKQCLDDKGHTFGDQVTRQFSDTGIEFSGGFDQRLAISRALACDSGNIIMDEPSLALDPRAEKELFDMLSRLFSHKTQIIISHRMTNANDFDKIIVIDNGRLLAEGTHNSAKNIEKYHQLCTFEKTLTVSSMKEKNCLVESVATFLACKLLRIKVNFHIGIQKGERFASHAWTELADMEEKAYLRRVYDLML